MYNIDGQHPFDALWHQQQIYPHKQHRQFIRIRVIHPVVPDRRYASHPDGGTSIIRLLLTVTVLLLTGLSFVTAALSTLARQDDPAVDLFSAYADLLQGSLSPEFICQDVTPIQDELKSDAHRQLCSLYPTQGAFSPIHVLIGDRFYQVRFTPRGRALTLGHLARLWGRPQIRSVYRGQMILRWPLQGMTAEVDHQFSYFLPIEHLIFTRREQTSSSGEGGSGASQ
ncbi:MAG: hypothetical protein K8I30_03535 [Anaerolineae bacterium]|nr:hypothetical protein [Anaerolineae bacterium]